MHRFHLPPEQCTGSTLTLSGSEAHHAMRVLRIQHGESVVVLDGVGGKFLCEVRDARRDTLELAVIEKENIAPLPCQITLLQSVPKGKIFDSIIQKATELEVFRIIPILSERVVVHVDDNNASQKSAKWQHVAIEAVKQSGTAWLPKMDSPITPGQFIARGESFELSVVGSLRNDARHPRECFRQFEAKHGRLPKSACVWIGPEGDFTPEEMSAIQGAGSLPITLGRFVLRVETAALYCLSILNYELQPSDANRRK